MKIINFFVFICCCYSLLLVFSSASSKIVASTSEKSEQHKKFCIVGAGMAGVQTAYFFKRFGLDNDYIAFERNAGAGSFFETYPRQGNLISINKVYTGTNDTEFNLRHDWNSLLNHEKFDKIADPFHYYPAHYSDADDESEEPLLFKEFNQDYFPRAHFIPKYANRFVAKYKLNIRFNSDVVSVKRDKKQGSSSSTSGNQKHRNFHIQVQDTHDKSKPAQMYSCGAVILAAGKSVERAFKLKEGTQYLTSYTNAPTDTASYRNQDILILGGGNSAFELALAMESHTALIHIASRNPVQLAFQSHYVGDVRAVNLGFLDRYQLKSMDVLMTMASADIREGRLYKDEETGKICLRTKSKKEEQEMKKAFYPETVGTDNNNNDESGEEEEMNNKANNNKRENAQDRNGVNQMKLEYEASMELFPSRRCYHRVISCLGFRFNSTPFSTTTMNNKIITNDKSNNNNNDDLVPVQPLTDSSDSFVEVASNFESVNVPDLFVAGALAHFRDFKRSAGGFIHGFRYSARTLVGMLRERYAEAPTTSDKASSAFPFIPFTTKDQILKRFMWRLKNVSSLYQMQSQLTDAVLIAGPNDYRYYQDLPLDNLKSKNPKFVSINAFKNSSLHFLTMSLEFGKDFQGVGVLHHQAQQETYKRRAEKMLWDHAQPMADPDFRLTRQRVASSATSENNNDGEDTLVLQKLEKVTAQELMMREAKMMTEQGNQHHTPAAPHKTTLLNELQGPPKMMPAKEGKPPKLDRFLFLHPVIREFQRTPASEGMGSLAKIESVKLTLRREVRLHEDVLNDFTGKHHHETPLKNFLDAALQ